MGLLNVTGLYCRFHTHLQKQASCGETLLPERPHRTSSWSLKPDLDKENPVKSETAVQRRGTFLSDPSHSYELVSEPEWRCPVVQSSTQSVGTLFYLRVLQGFSSSRGTAPIFASGVG